MSRRLGPSSLGLAAAVLILAGCGTGGSSSASPPAATAPPTATGGGSATFEPTPQDFRAIRRLMAAQAKAVLADDEHAFLATVDPQQPKLVAQQRVLFDNLSQLAVTGLHYAIDTSALVPARIPGDDPVLHPAVVEHLQIAQTLTAPVSNPVNLSFVQRDGHWLVGAASQPKDNDPFDSPQERPWFGVPVVARRDGPLTVLVDQSAADSLDRLTTAIHDDISYDAQLLGVPASYRVLVDATSNGLAYDFSSLRSSRRPRSRSPSASRTRSGSTPRPRRHAIKINPKQVDEVVADAGLLRHELTHFLLHEYTGSNPKWLVEGVATWMQYYPDDFTALQHPRADLYPSLMSADRALPEHRPLQRRPRRQLPDRAGSGDLARRPCGMREAARADEGLPDPLPGRERRTPSPRGCSATSTA